MRKTHFKVKRVATIKVTVHIEAASPEAWDDAWTSLIIDGAPRTVRWGCGKSGSWSITRIKEHPLGSRPVRKTKQ